ncbi:DMT family transporter [Paraclostridium sordellii]|uniref:DMT family transporter n=1 Tax=Paraclostridium sordellii TaxID=1505 RepID=UPI0021BB6AA4
MDNLEKIIAILFAVLAGISTTLEAFVNGELGEQTTPIIATFLSLVVGSIFFLITMFITGDIKSIFTLDKITPKFLLGGIFGGCIIFFTVKAVAHLGLSKTLTIIVISQIILGFAIDIFILNTQEIHLYKFIGIFMLISGTFFILS